MEFLGVEGGLAGRCRCLRTEILGGAFERGYGLDDLMMCVSAAGELTESCGVLSLVEDGIWVQ